MLNLKSNNHNLNPKSNVRYRAYYFSLAIIKFVSSFPEKRIYWIISDQLLRAATSIGANLIEAKASSSKKDFIKFYQIALKCSNETAYWLCLLRDGNLLLTSGVKDLVQENNEISKMIGSSLLTMKRKKDLGI